MTKNEKNNSIQLKINIVIASKSEQNKMSSCTIVQNCWENVGQNYFNWYMYMYIYIYYKVKTNKRFNLEPLGTSVLYVTLNM